MYVGKNTSRGARVEDGEAVEARSGALAVGRALPCPAASLQIGKGADKVCPRDLQRDFLFQLVPVPEGVAYLLAEADIRGARRVEDDSV